MNQNSEHSSEEHSNLARTFQTKHLYLGIGILLAIVLFTIADGMTWIGSIIGIFFLGAVFHRVPYLSLVILFLLASAIGLLRSDKYDNTILFYGSAFLFCFSVIGGIIYFVAPIIFLLVARD